ncbi:hypothetical protein NEOLEDRAFT_282532 [Neolentinus lepideus HHB14362 ss-1]|uniref:EF-hand domain-containing protein n=1 Tax=Neolentinus lepideus HHB14362 ss-1 TaxID=1314782 RepID=A0A165SYV5_9AGAM|nr:hypothetical protein NEOLEDRAFT_282532 [Neolentinus lepideus HHB14362 ss-1]
MMARKTRGPDSEKIQEAFKGLDKDRNGYIDHADLRRVMADPGKTTTDDDREVDLGDGGQINYRASELHVHLQIPSFDCPPSHMDYFCLTFLETRLCHTVISGLLESTVAKAYLTGRRPLEWSSS